MLHAKSHDSLLKDRFEYVFNLHVDDSIFSAFFHPGHVRDPERDKKSSA